MEQHNNADAQGDVAAQDVVTDEDTIFLAAASDSKLIITEVEELAAQMGARDGNHANTVPPERGGPAPAQPDEQQKPIESNAESAAKAGHDAARENMSTAHHHLTGSLLRGTDTPTHGGDVGGAESLVGSGTRDMIMADTAMAQSAPATGRGRGRGRGGGRPRGRGRGGGRGGKRKRNEDGDDDDDDDDDGASDSSDEIAPIVTITKSGRSIQKPTSFVPPPPSPPTNKRRRHYTNRKHPESAVCKVCLRGTSPASNQVVFCDGCNAPYHQWCHKPPIPNSVTDVVDKEWFCAECESERVIPVPEEDVASFVSGEGISAEERQQYFSRLPPGMLVTLLTKATTLKPDLPLFSPGFKTEQKANAVGSALTNGHASSSSNTRTPPARPSQSYPRPARPLKTITHPDDDNYGPDTHPSHYPRPGQGLMSTLPPETEDLQYLVEDEDKHGVFTHVYRTDMAATIGPNNGPGTGSSRRDE